MQRAPLDPRGRQWLVHVQWLGRRVGRDTLLARYAHRRAARRARKASDAASLRSGSRQQRREDRWYDFLDLDPGCLDIGELPAVLLVIIGVVLLVWLGPGLIALLVGLGEFVLVLLGAVAVFVWRTVARRPWAVVATDGEVTYTWSVTGYRKARAVVLSAAESVARGTGAVTVGPGLDVDVVGVRRTRGAETDRGL